MKANLEYDIKIEVYFTNAEIRLITKNLKSSEYSCEILNKHGFWYKYIDIRKKFKVGRHKHFNYLTFRQIDKIIKTFEVYTYWKIDKCPLAVKLSNDLTYILNSVNNLSKATNKPIKISFN